MGEAFDGYLLIGLWIKRFPPRLASCPAAKIKEKQIQPIRLIYELEMRSLAKSDSDKPSFF